MQQAPQSGLVGSTYGEGTPSVLAQYAPESYGLTGGAAPVKSSAAPEKKMPAFPGDDLPPDGGGDTGGGVLPTPTGGGTPPATGGGTPPATGGTVDTSTWGNQYTGSGHPGKNNSWVGDKPGTGQWRYQADGKTPEWWNWRGDTYSWGSQQGLKGDAPPEQHPPTAPVQGQDYTTGGGWDQELLGLTPTKPASPDKLPNLAPAPTPQISGGFDDGEFNDIPSYKRKYYGGISRQYDGL